jgi:hypothetical protein
MTDGNYAVLDDFFTRARQHSGRLTRHEITLMASMLAHQRYRDYSWSLIGKAGGHNADARLLMAVLRLAPPGQIAPPATLLAWILWQEGKTIGTQQALALALEDTPGYSLALLIDADVRAGAPADAAPLMTPQAVIDAYDN